MSAPGRPWFVLQHVAHEAPGSLGTALAAAGAALEVRRLDRGDAVPGPAELEGAGGLVVMGGPMGVHDDRVHPWLAPERRLLAAAVARPLPVVGICLGAQQLAAALGAEVAPGPAPEIGVGTVELTEAGRADPVLGPAGSPLPCLHWHGDTFSLPDGAVHLAASAAYPHQAFRFGPSAYGLQFHLEVDEALAAAFAPHLAGVDLGPAAVARLTAAGTGVARRLAALAPG